MIKHCLSLPLSFSLSLQETNNKIDRSRFLVLSACPPPECSWLRIFHGKIKEYNFIYRINPAPRFKTGVVSVSPYLQPGEAPCLKKGQAGPALAHTGFQEATSSQKGT